ncbi:MAG: hypothetical protein AB7U20_14750 [Planctomycetaceae bacterium]
MWTKKWYRVDCTGCWLSIVGIPGMTLILFNMRVPQSLRIAVATAFISGLLLFMSGALMTDLDQDIATTSTSASAQLGSSIHPNSPKDAHG